MEGFRGLLHIWWALFFGIRRGSGGGGGVGGGLFGGIRIAGRGRVARRYRRFWVRLDNFFFACVLQRFQVFQAAGIVALDAALIAGQPIEDLVFAAIEMIGKGQRVGPAVFVKLLGIGL